MVHLAGAIDPAAVDHLIMQNLEHWDKPTHHLLDQIENLLNRRLGEAVHAAFSQWEKTDLYALVWATTNGFLQQCRGEHAQVVAQYLRHETGAQPSTENTEYLKRARQTFLDRTQPQRDRARALKILKYDIARGADPTEVEQKLAAEKNKIRDVFAKHPDPMKREMDAMAEVWGYCSVASLRFIDAVCRSLEVEVFKKIEHELRSEIQLKVLLVNDGMSQQDRCEALLAEDQNSARKRRELIGELERLGLAKRKLDELRVKHSLGAVESAESGTLEEDADMYDA